MSSSVSEENLEKKFQGVANTQDSIQTLSLWLLHHKAHHQKIVAAWMKVLQRAKISHRLTLFYLANDVVQNGKRKGFVQFGNSFAEVLREATLLVRDDQIRSNIGRVFNIWEERSVYSPEFIAELRAILANTRVPATAPSKLLAEFKPENVIEKIKSVVKLEQDISAKVSTINLNKLNAKKTEIVQQFKDRTHGQQFKKDFDASLNNVEDLIQLMTQEVEDRQELILLLEQSEIYYDTQRGEAKIVANAYKNFGQRVKTLQKKLDELIATFPSPIPSPCPDAPSPTTSDHELELKLPNEKKQSGMTSWLDAFANKSKSLPDPAETPRNDPSSLESRLSNLLQNIPNLPAGLQTSLFSNVSSGNNTPLLDTANSPVSNKKDKTNDSLAGVDITPKDEYSGQNTPLQDEDTHSSHSFFTKLASSNKTHSPKDILKGLTSLIQSASAEKSDGMPKKEVYFDHSNPYNPSGGMSSFIKDNAPSVSQASQISSSPSSYFSSPQPGLPAPLNTSPVAQTSALNSYQTVPLHTIPSYSSKPESDENEHLSYIPSLVPSTVHDAFDFVPDSYGAEEYNPEMDHFDTDMAIDNIDSTDVPSPEAEPPETVIDKMPRSIGGRRLSTLITVVTKDSPDDSLHTDTPYSLDTMYTGDIDHRVKNPPTWENNSVVVTETVLSVPQSCVTTTTVISSPTEEFFIGKEVSVPPFYNASVPPPPLPPVMEQKPIELGPVNGQNVKPLEPLPQIMNTPPPNCRLSQIETVQSHRENINGRWFGDDWSEPDHEVRFYEPDFPPIPPPPMPGHIQNQPPRFFDNKRNFPPPNFQPRNNWMPRNRPDRFHPHHPYRSGPPPNNKRFPFRGRGWGRQQPRF
ncbi:regulation of nuclear pre-mRNA domain-containing protein 2-like isoform X2 [Uloborus diversus]|uniref:regulation of nuclear pre-mRNA domain-containing protein 2-like isoform X2 n=1 Tax=Uloborus diversus TaxID=327109 RepID=UPI00240984D7|nr:regulation of nuclear pre-mRNA domain-containing protein 2-like isoform X2 [Uloborus diversus]